MQALGGRYEVLWTLDDAGGIETFAARDVRTSASRPRGKGSTSASPCATTARG